MSPPEIKFVTPICHPNVHFKVLSLKLLDDIKRLHVLSKQTGEICLDILKTSWAGTYTISTTLTSVHQLLTSAEPDSPLNVDIAQLFRQGDMVAAEALIRFYTVTERAGRY